MALDLPGLVFYPFPFAHSAPCLLTSRLFLQQINQLSPFSMLFPPLGLSFPLLWIDLSLPLGFSQIASYPKDCTTLSEMASFFTFYPFTLLSFSSKHFSLLDILYLFTHF